MNILWNDGTRLSVMLLRSPHRAKQLVSIAKIATKPRGTTGAALSLLIPLFLRRLVKREVGENLLRMLEIFR